MTVIQSNGKLDVRSRVTEAAGPVESDDYLYRLTTAARRELPQVTHDRAQELCYDLYQQNPLGHRLTELIPDFVVGDGITYSALNPFVRDVIEEFWDDDVNDLTQRQHDFALELGLYGELLPQALTGDVSGVVQLGYVDPGQIKRVVTVEGNPMVPDRIFIRQKGAGVTGKELQVIRDRGNGMLEGDVFYLRVNAVSNANRGWPDLLHIADWVVAFDSLLWEMIERARLARSFIWDVLLKGADQTTVDNWIRTHGDAPKSGSVRAHNDQIEWKAVAPELGSFETAREADEIRDHIAAGAGVPKHWLSSSADVNRATALEMGTPTIKRLGRRQSYYLAGIKRILRYVIEQAIDRQRIKGVENGMVEVYDVDGNGTGEMVSPTKAVVLHAPEISPRDTYRAGQLLQQLGIFLGQAEESGWFGQDTSRRVIASVLSQMGVEFNPEAQQNVEPKPKPIPKPVPIVPVR